MQPPKATGPALSAWMATPVAKASGSVSPPSRHLQASPGKGVAMSFVGVSIRRFQVSTVGSRERGDQSPRRPEFLRANREMARL
jgi:hypothetical protein